MSTAENLRDKGRVEGRAEGRAEGIEEGKTKAKLEEENKIYNAFVKYKNIELIADVFSITEDKVRGILRNKGLMVK